MAKTSHLLAGEIMTSVQQPRRKAAGDISSKGVNRAAALLPAHSAARIKRQSAWAYNQINHEGIIA